MLSVSVVMGEQLVSPRLGRYASGFFGGEAPEVLRFPVMTEVRFPFLASCVPAHPAYTAFAIARPALLVFYVLLLRG